MTCRKHPTDHSSSVGVCASCLRERLFVIIVAQAEAQAKGQAQAQLQEDRHSHEPPPPLVFPRSVSPYVSRRKSDNAAWSRHHDNNLHCFTDHRFYSTPQVRSNGAVIVAGSLKKKKNSRFSIFSHLFRSKSEKIDLDPRVSESRDSRAASSSSSSPFWFSNMLYSRQRKQSRMSSVSESTAERNRRDCANRHRGMFPARYSDEEEEEEGDQYCGGSSGYSSESSRGWKQTPRRTTADVRRGGRQTYNCNVSGLAFGLSPLVRASPNQSWSQKAMPPDVGLSSSEIRQPTNSHLANTASFCKNRSRKLVDLGRFTQNR